MFTSQAIATLYRYQDLRRLAACRAELARAMRTRRGLEGRGRR